MKYSFQVVAGISMHVEVEAASLEEAVEKAQSAGVISLCHQCAGSHHGEWSTSGELDCDPAACTLTSVYAGDEELDEEKVSW